MWPELTMNLRNNPEKLRAVGRIFWKNINRCIIHESLSFFQNSIERRQLVLWSLAALSAFLRRQTSSARIRQIVTVLALMTSATGQRQFGIIVKMLQVPEFTGWRNFVFCPKCKCSQLELEHYLNNLRLCFASTVFLRNSIHTFLLFKCMNLHILSICLWSYYQL